MTNPDMYTDPTLIDTLRATGAPRILTDRKDGTVVYVALDGDGNLIEVTA
ncbi:hypothetical protein [Microbacterium sp. A1-JK]